MTQDARFEDVQDKPLNLGALEPDDVQIISSLTQDSVVNVSDISWQAKKRRIVLLINRFRWEYQAHAGSKPERVRSLLVIDNVMRVSTMGINRNHPDTTLSLLEIEYIPGTDGAGEINLILAGDGAFRIETEALELSLKDVTRPYQAPSGKTPDHGI